MRARDRDQRFLAGAIRIALEVRWCMRALLPEDSTGCRQLATSRVQHPSGFGKKREAPAIRTR